MIKVYTASKLCHASLWKELRDDWTEIEFTARWPIHYMSGDNPRWPEDPNFGSIFWRHDVEDVTRADVVLCYGGADEILRGALVEAGIALGQGKRVICVGHSHSFGTWQYHDNVHWVATLLEARSLLALVELDLKFNP